MRELFITAGSAGLVDLVVRATILLSVALVLQWLFRNWPAVTRHRLWTLTFVLLLALPALRQFGPSWDVPLLPNAGRLSEPVRGVEVPDPVAQTGSAVSAPPLASLVTDRSTGEGKPEPPPAGPWIRVAFMVWAVGCGAVLVSLGVGVRRFSRLVQAGKSVQDKAWISQLDTLRERLSTRARVRLVLAEEPVTPMTGGVFQPVILLPASATDWPEARRHAVLSHELVHVRRRDALRQLLGRAVLALYWFHPLSWVASHLAAARREEACDDEVLAVGARPSEYAGHLLALAESGSFRRSDLSLPLALQSQLERRVRAILRPRGPRPRAVVAAVVLMAAAMGGVSVSIANPTRAGNAPGAGAEAAAIGATALDCVPASEAGELSGWEFAQGLDSVLVCTIQDATVTTATNGTRVIGPADWGVLEGEIRKQLEERRPGLP